MVPAIIGSIQATEAIKILIGAPEINREIILIDVWTDTFDHIKIKPRKDCPACNGNYEFLETKFALKTASLCGQSRAVQIVNTKTKTVSLGNLAAQLKDVNNIFQNKYMLRFEAKDHQFTVFPDGRAIIKNTIDESGAQQLYDKYVGRFLLSG
jgi:adenylyltransferase/sulfurtransferase